MQSDTTELRALAADLGEVTGSTAANIVKAVGITALRVKRDWAAGLAGMKHLPLLPYAVDYELTGQAGLPSSSVTAEIGINKGRNSQAPLGVFAEYGSVNNPPKLIGLKALLANETDFTDGLSKAVDSGLKENEL